MIFVESMMHFCQEEKKETGRKVYLYYTPVVAYHPCPSNRIFDVVSWIWSNEAIRQKMTNCFEWFSFFISILIGFVLFRSSQYLQNGPTTFILESPNAPKAFSSRRRWRREQTQSRLGFIWSDGFGCWIHAGSWCLCACWTNCQRSGWTFCYHFFCHSRISIAFSGWV